MGVGAELIERNPEGSQIADPSKQRAPPRFKTVITMFHSQR